MIEAWWHVCVVYPGVLGEIVIVKRKCELLKLFQCRTSRNLLWVLEGHLDVLPVLAGGAFTTTGRV